MSFDDYVLKKKIKLLYFLYTRIYSFTLCQDYDYDLLMYEKDGIDDGYAELAGTQNMSIDERIKIHSIIYKQLKPKDIILGANGQQLLCEVV